MGHLGMVWPSDGGCDQVCRPGVTGQVSSLLSPCDRAPQEDASTELSILCV